MKQALELQYLKTLYFGISEDLGGTRLLEVQISSVWCMRSFFFRDAHVNIGKISAQLHLRRPTPNSG